MSTNNYKLDEFFIKRLRQAISKRGFSQAKFARIAGITPGYLTDIMKGRTTPSDRVITAICLNHTLSESWLTQGVGEMEKVLVTPGGETVRYADIMLPACDQEKNRKSLLVREDNQDSVTVTVSDSSIETNFERIELHPHPLKQRQGRSDRFDWDLHNEITQMICEAQLQLDVTVRPDKFGGLVRMLYEDHLAGIEVTPAKIIQLVRLAA